MANTNSPSRARLLAAAFREYDPVKAAALASELRGIVQRLTPIETSMKRSDWRYLQTMRQFSERADLLERIAERKLIWMRRMVAEYLGNEGALA